MSIMTKEMMLEANGGVVGANAYMCTKCGTKAPTVEKIRLHCLLKHGVANCYRSLVHIM